MADHARTSASDNGALESSHNHLDNSYQLDFDYESPVRPPRRWSSLNSNSAPQMSMSTSALFKSPQRSISSSGPPHRQTSATASSSANGSTGGKSFHDSISHMNATVTAPTSSGSYLRSNFKAQTKSSATSTWQLPTAATTSSGAETPDWMRKLKHARGGDNETAESQGNGTDEAIPEWKKKFLEMKGGSSADVHDENEQLRATRTDECTGEAERETQQPQLVMEKSNSQARGIATANATPEWKRKFLQMKIATDAAQSHDDDPLDRSPGAGRTNVGCTAAPEDGAASSPASLPTWKKSIAKSRHVQAELLSLGLRDSSSEVDADKPAPSDAAVPSAKGLSTSKTGDGTPEWMKKFQSMKFEKEECVIEAGGKQDPGVVTNGNGVVVSWARTQTKTSTTQMEETDNHLSLVSTTKVKSKKTCSAVAHAPPESSTLREDSVELPASSANIEIFCQLCDQRGHSAKECPQLFATPHEMVDPAAAITVRFATPDDSPIYPDQSLDGNVNEKKKKKKSKLAKDVIGDVQVPDSDSPGVASSPGPTVTDNDGTDANDPDGAGEPSIVPVKKKKKKKILEEGGTEAGVDCTAPSAGVTIGAVNTISNEVDAEMYHIAPCQDAADANTILKKKKKKKKELSTENDANQDEAQPQVADAAHPVGPTQDPNAQGCITSAPKRGSAMHESFSVTELSSEPTKAKRKKKKIRNDESDEALGVITGDSQSEMSKAGVMTETTTPMNESYSSTGESSIDVISRDRTKKTRRKKNGNEEPVGRMNDSCSSVESSGVSSRAQKPSPYIDGEHGLHQASTGSRRPRNETACTPEDDADATECPDTTSQRSSCEGSKSSSSAVSSKCSNPSGSSNVSAATKTKIMEDRIQIINTLNAFLELSKERIANREARIPEGSLRANEGTKGTIQKQERRASTGISGRHCESSSRITTSKAKTQTSIRKSHRRRSCTGSNATHGSSSVRDGSRRNLLSDQPPSSSRRRAGQHNKSASRRRIARDPEPDLKPAEGPTEHEEVFHVLSHNASFQMSRQKIFLPTDFDDFDEAELSDANSCHDAAAEHEKASHFDDGFGLPSDVKAALTEAGSSFQKLSLASPATVGSYDREILSMGFSFSSLSGPGGANSFFGDPSSDPFAQSNSVAGATEDFGDTSGSFWESSSNEPTSERRRSVEPLSSTSTNKQQRRRNGEAPTRLSRRQSATAGRSNSFQDAK